MCKSSRDSMWNKLKVAHVNKRCLTPGTRVWRGPTGRSWCRACRWPGPSCSWGSRRGRGCGWPAPALGPPRSRCYPRVETLNTSSTVDTIAPLTWYSFRTWNVAWILGKCHDIDMSTLPSRYYIYSSTRVYFTSSSRRGPCWRPPSWSGSWWGRRSTAWPRPPGWSRRGWRRWLCSGAWTRCCRWWARRSSGMTWDPWPGPVPWCVNKYCHRVELFNIDIDEHWQWCSHLCFHTLRTFQYTSEYWAECKYIISMYTDVKFKNSITMRLPRLSRVSLLTLRWIKSNWERQLHDTRSVTSYLQINLFVDSKSSTHLQRHFTFAFLVNCTAKLCNIKHLKLSTGITFVFNHQWTVSDIGGILLARYFTLCRIVDVCR